MPELDREVAGLRCREVLAELSDYVDGELPADRVERIKAHLRGCDWCERFGGDFAWLVKSLRRQLGEAEPLEEEVERRFHTGLRQRLRRSPD